jgi:hypothetical protein
MKEVGFFGKLVVRVSYQQQPKDRSSCGGIGHIIMAVKLVVVKRMSGTGTFFLSSLLNLKYGTNPLCSI